MMAPFESQIEDSFIMPIELAGLEMFHGFYILWYIGDPRVDHNKSLDPKGYDNISKIINLSA